MSSEEHTDDCPKRSELADLSAGRLAESRVAAIEEHLTHCDRCCRLLEDVGATFLEELLPPETTPTRDNTDRPDSLQRTIDELKSQPVEFRDDSIEADDALETILADSPSEGSGLGRIGSYEVRREVARGGMGIVLEGFDPDLQRIVAIKVLSPTLASHGQFRAAFLREARAAARLQHENVMPIYAVEQAGPLPYFVMPFVEGPTLQEYLNEGGALPVDEAVRIGHQLSRALEEAHGQGLVHGDLKPGNVMLLDGESDRRVWLADFGLTRATGEQAFEAKGGGAAIAGTPGFMAPEQARGQPIDARADLYAFGCVLRAMLAEKHSPESPSASIPDWLSRLIAQLLEEDPKNRPQSATAVRELLEPHLAPRSISRRLIIAGAAVLIGAAAFSIFRPGEEKLPEGYLVAGSDVLHATLEEAVDAAGPGDTVVVRHNGEIEIEHIAIPAGKPLRIRAAQGHHPVFVSKSWRTTMIESDAPLCLEGLEFRHPFADYPSEAAPILRCRSSSVFLSNCRFERSTTERRQPGTRLATKPILQFENCPQVEVVNCELYTMIGTHLAVDVTETVFEQSLRVENCLLVGLFGIRLDAPPASRHRWRISGNTFAGSVPLSIWTRGAKFPMIDIDHRRNVFDFLGSLLELRVLGGESTLKVTRERVRLTGDSNFYRPTGRLTTDGEATYAQLTLAPGRDAETVNIDTIERFTQAFGPTGRELQEPVFDWKEIDAYRAKFSLMKAELFELKGTLSNEDEKPGFNPLLLGPGESHDRWRESEAGQGWQREVVDALITGS